MDIQETLHFILQNIEQSRAVVRAAYSIRHQLVESAINGRITEREFYTITSLLSSQSRSPIWEKYFREKHGGRKVHKDENRGDIEINGKFYEFKSSGFNQDGTVNIIQIRLWQNCDYIIQYVADHETLTFILTHDEMVLETKLMNARSAHGTKEVIDINQLVELRITLVPDSEDWKRWLENYQKVHFPDAS